MLDQGGISSTLLTIMLLGRNLSELSDLSSLSWRTIIVLTLIFAVTYYQKIKRGIDSIYNWRVKASITIKGIIESKKHQIDYMFPKEFEAIMWYIRTSNINLGSMKIINMKRYYKEERAIYVPGNISSLYISDGIYFKSIITDISKEQSSGNEYEIVIYSYIKNFYEIDKFIQTIKNDFINSEKYKLHDQHKIFSVIRDKDGDNEYNCSAISSDFVSNKSFDNIFFEQKSEIKNRLDFFLNNEQFYKKKGIPYTLGFLLYGTP